MLDTGTDSADNVRYTTHVWRVYLTLADRAAAGPALTGVLSVPDATLAGDLLMTLDLSDWAQLEDGIYLHRAQPRLVIVPAELPLPAWCRDMVRIHDRGLWMRAIYDHARATYEEVVDADVQYTDVLMTEVTSYVV
jgi:hypothetical protein